MEGEVVNTMQTLITNLTPAVTEAFNLLGQAVETVVSNPYLMLSTGVFLAGAGIGLFSRILRK